MYLWPILHVTYKVAKFKGAHHAIQERYQMACGSAPRQNPVFVMQLPVTFVCCTVLYQVYTSVTYVYQVSSTNVE